MSKADEGKPVVDSNGERIATIERVDEGVPLVDPKSEIDPTTARALGWTSDSSLYELRHQSIGTVTDAAVHLETNL
ncbi:hypothetical protein VB773_11950 [Haloarculaceae archaeon H-GB2-1]|nr:hypothetical protein [Haloarculaceae archaeon H-GB1-1]MEA5386675.1 hypothetical protein [Haloarculaceae archaeon H-GB11]MEA5408199.1 hypothetical protein [Haloarculaceae archaeon H-GB2-1]